MVRRSIILVLSAACALLAHAQVNCFVRTQLDRRNVYAQQPFKVMFTVLTATWYTAPLEFDNIQIPNAFIIPFDRTQSGMFPVGGKQYPGLQFYFIVFPYVSGKYTIPSIKIIATTPAEGDSKPQKVTLVTKPEPFIVKPEPPEFKEGRWFVAKGVTIDQDWSRSLKNLKVGDVLERTISIDARGTLPQFIPAFGKDSLEWASVYTREPTLTDTRDEYDANGRLTQTFTYLLEKEGTFTFPAEEIKWWNPYSSKVYARSAGSTSIRVQANPNLGMLATLKDSLNEVNPVVKSGQQPRKGPLLIHGIPWYLFGLYAGVGLFLVYVLVRLLVWAYRYARIAYAAYQLSERHWFRKLMNSRTALPVFLNNLYAWWDRYPLAGKSPSITAAARALDEDDLQQELGVYFKLRYAANQEGATDENAASDDKATPFFKKKLKQFRNTHKTHNV